MLPPDDDPTDPRARTVSIGLNDTVVPARIAKFWQKPKYNFPFCVGLDVGLLVFPALICFVGEGLGLLRFVGDEVGGQVCTPLEGDLDLYEGDFDVTYLVVGDALFDVVEGDFDTSEGGNVLPLLVVGALDLRRRLVVGDKVGLFLMPTPPPPPV
jgi:hypothetical protein